jgi:uncharacterized protein YukE
MANYNFSPDGALDTRQELISITGRLTNSLADLQQNVQVFMTTNQGDSVTNYGEAQQLWNDGQTEMNQYVTQAANALQNIYEEYMLGDRKGAVVFSQNI